VNLVREEERRGPKTWLKGTNRDKNSGQIFELGNLGGTCQG
jgi:hypothetical protein